MNKEVNGFVFRGEEEVEQRHNNNNNNNNNSSKNTHILFAKLSKGGTVTSQSGSHIAL